MCIVPTVLTTSPFHHIDHEKSIIFTGYKAVCREPVQYLSSQVEQTIRPSRSSKFGLNPAVTTIHGEQAVTGG
jgi:hypothetical protein